MGDDQFDLIVVGLGAMGAATLFHACRQGLRVLGIDRHDPPHEFGSSHAETRITRLAVGEGAHYVPFARRSHEIWREVEDQTGQPLLYQSGNCIIATRAGSDETRWHDFVTATADVATAEDIDFRQLSPAEFRREQPAVLVRDDDRVGIEPTGGIVLSERAIELQLALARSLGADIRTNEPVSTIDPDATGVSVTTNSGTYRADRVVVSAGPWMPEFTDPKDGAELTVTRQVVFWFQVEDISAFSTDNFPGILWIGDSIDDYLGVFPIPSTGTQGLKVLGEQFTTITAASSVDRTVSAAEIESFYERLVRPRLSGVTPTCLRAAVCLYTNTPDEHFFIDTDARSDRVIVMSPCSGHGFKHSTALGEAVAQVVASGHSDLDLSPFQRRW